MNRNNKKVIKIKGNSPQPDLNEINEMGLQGWTLDDVRRDCRNEVDEYTYSQEGEGLLVFTYLN